MTHIKIETNSWTTPRVMILRILRRKQMMARLVSLLVELGLSCRVQESECRVDARLWSCSWRSCRTRDSGKGTVRCQRRLEWPVMALWRVSSVITQQMKKGRQTETYLKTFKSTGLACRDCFSHSCISILQRQTPIAVLSDGCRLHCRCFIESRPAQFP